MHGENQSEHSLPSWAEIDSEPLSSVPLLQCLLKQEEVRSFVKDSSVVD